MSSLVSFVRSQPGHQPPGQGPAVGGQAKRWVAPAAWTSPLGSQGPPLRGLDMGESETQFRDWQGPTWAHWGGPTRSLCPHLPGTFSCSLRSTFRCSAERAAGGRGRSGGQLHAGQAQSGSKAQGAGGRRDVVSMHQPLSRWTGGRIMAGGWWMGGRIMDGGWWMGGGQMGGGWWMGGGEMEGGW